MAALAENEEVAPEAPPAAGGGAEAPAAVAADGDADAAAAAAANAAARAPAELDEALLVQMKSYGTALTKEAKRWLKLAKSVEDLKGPEKEKEGDDDTMMANLVTEITGVLGTIPADIMPPAKVVKLLKKGPAAYIEFHLFCESEVGNPCKKLKTSTAGEVVEIYDDEEEKDSRKTGGGGRAKSDITMGEWMMAFPRYTVALAMTDRGCRENHASMLRYQSEVGRIASRANWKTVLKIEKRYRRERVRALVATGTELWKCFADGSYSAAHFTQGLSEELFFERSRARSSDDGKSRKGGKGKGKGRGSRVTGKTPEGNEPKKN